MYLFVLHFHPICFLLPRQEWQFQWQLAGMELFAVPKKEQEKNGREEKNPFYLVPMHVCFPIDIVVKSQEGI